MKIYPLILGIFLTTILSEANLLKAQTQDSTMNQTMRLERDFSPIIQQKNKIDRQPSTQPLQEKKSDATFANWQVESVKSSEIGVVPAGQVIATERDENMGYLQVSAGNYWNTDVKAGVKLGDLSIDAKGFYTTGNLKLPHPVSTPEGCVNKRWDSRLMTGDLQGTYSVTLNNDAQFEAHFGAAGTSVNTFNYQFLNDIYLDTLQQRTSSPSSQHWGQIRADASYETDQFKLFIGYDFTRLSTPDSMPNNWSNNTLMFKGTYGWYDNDAWQLSVDLGLGGVFGQDKNYFIFHPEFHYSFMPEYGTWRRIYADLGFGSHRESLMDVMNRMPLGYFETEYKSSVDLFDLKLGYEDNEQGYLRWGIEAELGLTKDELCAEASPIDTTTRDGIYMKIIQDDCFAFGVGAHCDYEYNRFFGAKANVKFRGYSCDAAGFAEPHVQMALHLLSNPGKVKMDLGFDLGLARNMQYMKTEYDLGSIADLNFRLDWNINDNLTVFAFGRNMLGIQYELWPGVPAQGFNFHGGFRWVF